jgi:uncharacterized protein
MKRTISSAGLLAAGLFTLTVAVAAPASAHVTVSSANAKQGGFSVLTFRVPTESPTASTIGLHVQFPLDTPLAFVSVQPHAGWTYKVTRSTLPTPIDLDGEKITEAITEIDWTANSAATAIKPGEFDQFNVSAGPLPAAESLTFKAIQRYSDGSEVDWINTPALGSTAKVEHPAPTLSLTPAVAPVAATESKDAASTSSARAGIALGGIGTALGAAGLGLGLRRRKG